MQTPPLERGIIPLKTIPANGHRRKEKRKVLINAFLFLLFLSLIVVALTLSYLNNNLFMDRLLIGTFIVGALFTLKFINKED